MYKYSLSSSIWPSEEALNQTIAHLSKVSAKVSDIKGRCENIICPHSVYMSALISYWNHWVNVNFISWKTCLCEKWNSSPLIDIK